MRLNDWFIPSLSGAVLLMFAVGIPADLPAQETSRMKPARDRAETAETRGEEEAAGTDTARARVIRAKARAVLVQDSSVVQPEKAVVPKATQPAPPATTLPQTEKAAAPAPTSGRTASVPVPKSTVTTAPPVAAPVAADRVARGIASNAAPVPAVAAKNLKAIPGYGTVQLVWSPAPGAVGYGIARKRVSNNETVHITGAQVTPEGAGLVTDTSFIDRTAIPDQQYIYYMSTYFRDQEGTYYFPPAASEGRVTAAPRPESGPAAAPATNLKAVASSNGITLSWTAPPLAHGYSITRREQVNGVWTGTPLENGKIFTTTSYTDQNVVYGRVYGYRLTTYFKSASGSLYSPPDSSEAGISASPKRMGPTRITFVAYASAGSFVDFRFAPAPGASGHKLLRAPFPPSPTQFAEPTCPCWNYTGDAASYAPGWARDMSSKTPGQKYTYKLRATFPDGEQIDSDNVIVEIPAPPKGATYVAATALGGGSVEITWVHDGQANSYNVWRWQGADREQMFNNRSPYSPKLLDTNLIPGRTYRYSVIAKYSDPNASATKDVTVTAR
jgi:large repetitive protein